MDLATIIGSVVSSLAVALPAAAWLSRTLIGHRLDKDLAQFKSALDADRARLDAEIRQRVETELGERSAMREYEFEARSRLYSAIGPLRFQLLLACRDLAGRVERRGLSDEHYSMSVDGYYGRSSLFRILRPLCLSEMIERQIAFADFSVDDGAVALLRFKRAAFTALSGGLLVGDHPKVNWNEQREHVFIDNLTRCANVLMDETEAGHRVLASHEFGDYLDDKANVAKVAPFPDILEDFSPSSKPLFWVRLVGYGLLCSQFVNKEGATVGFEQSRFPTRDLLAESNDPVITAQLDEYEQRCGQLTDLKL